MRVWRTEQRLYKITEMSHKRGTEVSYRMATGNEISKLLKAKEEMNGYIPGLGGDKSYSIIAVQVTEWRN